MKKIVLVFMVLAVTFTSAFAQEADFIDTEKKVNLKTNEVYLAAGSSSFVGLFSGIFVGIADAIPRSQGEGSNTTEAYPFGVTAGYNHFFWNHLGVGGFVSYALISVISAVFLCFNPLRTKPKRALWAKQRGESPMSHRAADMAVSAATMTN